MSDSITRINTQVANSVEDIFKILLKLIDEKDPYLKDKAFLLTMKDKDAHPVFISMDSIAAKRLIREMDKSGIPYMQFKIKGSTKDVLLIRPDDRKRVQDLENAIRIHAGLEIDTKSELDRALHLTEPDAKEYVIRGLTEYEAERIIGLSQNHKNSFTVVKEEMGNERFLIATHEKNAKQINGFILSAILENENKAKQMQEIIEGQHYLCQQKKEFNQALAEIQNTNRTKPAYLFSLTEPEKYIYIQPTGFEVVDRGMVTHSMNMASNPELYPDVLKLIGNSIPNYIYKLEEEVINSGGMKASLEEAKHHFPGGVVVKNYPMDKEFKEWVNRSLNPQNGFVFQHPEVIQSLNLSGFSVEYTHEHPEEASMLEQKLQYMEKQLMGLEKRLALIGTSIERPTLSVEELLSAQGYDSSLHNVFYSEKEVERVKSGAFCEDLTEDCRKETMKQQAEKTTPEKNQANQAVTNKRQAARARRESETIERK